MNRKPLSNGFVWRSMKTCAASAGKPPPVRAILVMAPPNMKPCLVYCLWPVIRRNGYCGKCVRGLNRRNHSRRTNSAWGRCSSTACAWRGRWACGPTAPSSCARWHGWTRRRKSICWPRSGPARWNWVWMTAKPSFPRKIEKSLQTFGTPSLKEKPRLREWKAACLAQPRTSPRAAGKSANFQRTYGLRLRRSSIS